MRDELLTRVAGHAGGVEGHNRSRHGKSRHVDAFCRQVTPQRYGECYSRYDRE